MDPRYGSPRSVDAVDPTASYDAWPTLPSTRPENRPRCSPCCRRRFSQTVVSVLEIVLMIMTVVYSFFFPEKYFKQILPADSGKDSQIVELSEWTLRMFGSMVCVQVSISHQLLYCTNISWDKQTNRNKLFTSSFTILLRDN